VWDSNSSSGTDTSYRSIQGQRYASDGSTRGAEFQVNTYTTSDQEYPSVATDVDGDFVVVWHSFGSSGTDASLHSIQGQRYLSEGTALGAEFQVNSYTTNSQRTPSVAAEADGSFVVAWASGQPFASDSSIQAQRYSVAAAVPAVPSMSSTTRFALGAALMLLGAIYAMRRRS